MQRKPKWGGGGRQLQSNAQLVSTKSGHPGDSFMARVRNDGASKNKAYNYLGVYHTRKCFGNGKMAGKQSKKRKQALPEEGNRAISEEPRVRKVPH